MSCALCAGRAPGRPAPAPPPGPRAGAPLAWARLLPSAGASPRRALRVPAEQGRCSGLGSLGRARPGRRGQPPPSGRAEPPTRRVEPDGVSAADTRAQRSPVDPGRRKWRFTANRAPPSLGLLSNITKVCFREGPAGEQSLGRGGGGCSAPARSPRKRHPPQPRSLGGPRGWGLSSLRVPWRLWGLRLGPSPGPRPRGTELGRRPSYQSFCVNTNPLLGTFHP